MPYWVNRIYTVRRVSSGGGCSGYRRRVPSVQWRVHRVLVHDPSLYLGLVYDFQMIVVHIK